MLLCCKTDKMWCFYVVKICCKTVEIRWLYVVKELRYGVIMLKIIF